ncbi:MAG: sigma-54-dependent Fis family transcriptional regulator, partial [Candidatus Heimdallarchaeota archaeon]|nr:sigma-54-dependent Fis family transcriptional regulator [Candidatus Heimdallarchaeota archaeon]
MNKKRNIVANGNILVVDDSEDMLEVLRRNLTLKGYKTYTVSNVEEAIKILESTHIDLVLTDLKMPGVGGIELIKHVRANFKNIEVLVITGFPSIQGAVDAVKTGAEEYLVKSFTDEELYDAVERAVNKLNIRRANQVNLHSRKETFHGIIGESKLMQEIFEAIRKVSSTNATVLITGESGTGKELVARAIHYFGPRASYPFVPVNCGSIPEDLIESELFGHLKGTFTGATETRGGFFHTADRGTIFLDEISNTSLSMQIKLLRVLQDQEVYMVGAKESQKVDVRVIAATNVDLTELVKRNKFRDDLYYRINVLTINIPPLRERGDDILLLIQYFVKKFAKEASKPIPQLSDKAIQVLKEYHWFGNDRELQNIIQRFVIMSEEKIIDVPDLPSFMRFSALKEKGIRRT